MSMHQNNAGLYGRNDGQRSVSRPEANGTTPNRTVEEPNVYLKTKVLTASPAELRLMLIDGAIRFIEQARAGLLERNHERSFEGFSKARAIVTELISGLNPQADPELCDRLTGLYTFIFTRLVDAASERSIEIVDEVLEIFRFERETWSLLVESLANENTSASSVTSVPDVKPDTMQKQPGTQPGGLPTAGRISTTG
ncbi:MAG: flagellar export chaperone FliS [Phycisphaerales bacterium]|nr:flagellar export chaperone FliS [Phycisphaerales bacterium]